MVNRRDFIRIVGTTAGAGSAVLAGCNSASTEENTATPSPSPEPTRTGESMPVVTMNGSNAAGLFYFEPIGLYVKPGTTVVWDAESGQHSTKAFHPKYGQPLRIPNDAKPWYSGAMAHTRFKHTFEIAGTYDYFCDIHYNHGMVGRIVVDEPGGPAQGRTTPYGKVPAAQTIVKQGSVSNSEMKDNDE